MLNRLGSTAIFFLNDNTCFTVRFYPNAKWLELPNGINDQNNESKITIRVNNSLLIIQNLRHLYYIIWIEILRILRILSLG